MRSEDTDIDATVIDDISGRAVTQKKYMHHVNDGACNCSSHRERPAIDLVMVPLYIRTPR